MAVLTFGGDYYHKTRAENRDSKWLIRWDDFIELVKNEQTFFKKNATTSVQLEVLAMMLYFAVRTAVSASQIMDISVLSSLF